MNRHGTRGQGNTSVGGDGTPATRDDQASPVNDQDHGGGAPGAGQRGGGTGGKRAIGRIAGKDGPQTGGDERGNPGVGG